MPILTDKESPLYPMLRAIKLAHTAIWAVLAGSILALPVAGLTHRFRLAAILTVIIFVECGVLAANRGRFFSFPPHSGSSAILCPNSCGERAMKTSSTATAPAKPQTTLHASVAKAFLERYKKAWETRDADLAASLFTRDARYKENPFGEPITDELVKSYPELSRRLGHEYIMQRGQEER